MTQNIEAVFEGGAFRPLRPEEVIAHEGERVKLVVESEPLPKVLQLAMSVYDGLTEEEIDEIEKVILDRDGWNRRESQ
jgi:predicted DNA-binding antitoxin AbrB/MazE fold protein